VSEASVIVRDCQWHSIIANVRFYFQDTKRDKLTISEILLKTGTIIPSGCMPKVCCTLTDVSDRVNRSELRWRVLFHVPQHIEPGPAIHFSGSNETRPAAKYFIAVP
jgi:hypothetical protein